MHAYWKVTNIIINFHAVNSHLLQLFKNVAERGHWAEMLAKAHLMYKEGNIDGALLKYMLLAELGYEVAQSNVAYIFDQGTHASSL